jgi:hypothetical protein
MLASMTPPYRSSFGCSEIVPLSNKSFSLSTRALAPHCATSAVHPLLLLPRLQQENILFQLKITKMSRKRITALLPSQIRTQSSLIYPNQTIPICFICFCRSFPSLKRKSLLRAIIVKNASNFSGIRSFPLSSDFLASPPSSEAHEDVLRKHMKM